MIILLGWNYVCQQRRHTFLRLGSLGNPFSDESSLLVIDNVWRLMNSSVMPEIWVALQLSTFNSSTCQMSTITTIIITHSQQAYNNYSLALGLCKVIKYKISEWWNLINYAYNSSFSLPSLFCNDTSHDQKLGPCEEVTVSVRFDLFRLKKMRAIPRKGQPDSEK